MLATLIGYLAMLSVLIAFGFIFDGPGNWFFYSFGLLIFFGGLSLVVARLSVAPGVKIWLIPVHGISSVVSVLGVWFYFLTAFSLAAFAVIILLILNLFGTIIVLMSAARD